MTYRNIVETFDLRALEECAAAYHTIYPPLHDSWFTERFWSLRDGQIYFKDAIPVGVTYADAVCAMKNVVTVVKLGPIEESRIPNHDVYHEGPFVEYTPYTEYTECTLYQVTNDDWNGCVDMTLDSFVWVARKHGLGLHESWFDPALWSFAKNGVLYKRMMIGRWYDEAVLAVYLAASSLQKEYLNFSSLRTRAGPYVEVPFKRPNGDVKMVLVSVRNKDFAPYVISDK